MIQDNKLENEILELGKDIVFQMSEQKQYLNLKSAENVLMNWAMSNEDLKINLFRLVDTLPSLHSSSDVAKHIKEYFSNQETLAPSIRSAAKLSSYKIFSPIVSTIAKMQVKSMSKRFIAGKTPREALPAIKKLIKRDLHFTIDLLGEAALSEKESKIYLDRYIDLISTLSELNQSSQKKSDSNQDNYLNISIKLSSLYSQTKAVDFSRSVKVLTEKLAILFAEVKKHNGVAYVDMEDCAMTDITFEVIKNILSSQEFRKYDGFGFVMQAYLKRSLNDADNFIKWAKGRNTPVKIRLVKGAYWDSEYILSKQANWPCPVYLKKESSDASFEIISKKFLDAGDIIYPAFASHNIRSISHAICYAKMVGRKSDNFETQFLYGMGDEIKDVLISKNITARDYTPVGELLPGMAYLVRRLLENTANEGFLRQVNFDKIDPIMLLQKPNLRE